MKSHLSPMEMTPEIVASLNYAYKCLENDDEGMAVDAFLEYKMMENDYLIRTVGDRELEMMGY